MLCAPTLTTRRPEIFLTPSALRKPIWSPASNFSTWLRWPFPPLTTDAAYDSAYGSILAFDLGPQDLLIGGLEALGF